MRIALDTSILACAEGVDGARRQAEAIATIERLEADDLMLPIEVLGELFVVLLRKGRRSREEARAAVTGWAEGYRLVETSTTTFIDALELATSHRLGFWDSLILAAAAQAECRLLLTEDLQDGFT